MTFGAIQAYFDNYVAAFSRGDVNAVVGMWAFPAMITIPTGTFVFDEQAFHINTESLCEFYDRQGMAEARKKVSGFQELSSSVATVTTDDEIYNNKGELIAAWRHGYIMRETQHGIRAIAAVADNEIEAWAVRGTPLGKN